MHVALQVPVSSTDDAKVVAPGEYELFVSDGSLAPKLTRGLRIVA